jgi:hypothetical protein
MNTYKKYCPNVFIAQCSEKHEKGATIILTTKYGKEVENEVHNFLGMTGTKEEPKYLYSITRVDGFNAQERAKAKAERINGYASNAEKRSNEYYQASQEGRDFLSLGEPIKIGHHSEKRHRALIERNWNRMGKSIEESEKAEQYARRAEYWEDKANDINLSMPESLEYFEFKLEEAKRHHQNLKDNPSERAHGMSLQYANKAVKDVQTNLELAVKLWGSNEVVEQLNNEREEEQKNKFSKNPVFDALIKEFGGFWFFGSDIEKFKAKHSELIKSGFLEEGEKVCHIFAGLFVPIKHKDNFINLLKK